MRITRRIRDNLLFLAGSAVVDLSLQISRRDPPFLVSETRALVLRCSSITFLDDEFRVLDERQSVLSARRVKNIPLASIRGG